MQFKNCKHLSRASQSAAFDGNALARAGVRPLYNDLAPTEPGILYYILCIHSLEGSLKINFYISNINHDQMLNYMGT